MPRQHRGAEVPAIVLAAVIRSIAAVDQAIAQVPQGHFLLVDVLTVLGSLTRLTGRKYYCTGAITSRWIGVTALDDAGRLVLVFVARDTPGVRLDQDWNVMGQRGTVSGGAVFDNVPVDPELVLPYQNAFEGPQQFGARAQLVHTAIEVGIAGGALREAGEFVRTGARPFFEAARAGWADSAAQDPKGFGSPRLTDVLAVLECTVEHALPGGDHEIIVGRVRDVETSANPNGPLVFFRGSYASLTDQDLPACG